MLVHWRDDAHALGYDVIDTGHRLMVDAINRLNAFDRANGERDVVGECLADLERQMARQFHHEEAVMMLSRSPRLAEQQRAHDRFMEVLATLHRRHDHGEDVVALLLVNLVAFLSSHLRGDDMEEFGPTRDRRAA
ncbi:MAG: hemerythrin domain-containing protein [Pseudomonadota bacterium]